MSDDRRPFSFPLAGRFAPSEIRAFLQKFRQLPLRLRSERPLLYAILGDGTPPYKFAPKDVAYVADVTGLVPGSGQTDPHAVGYRHGQTCSNCQSAYQHVTTGTWLCDRVSGPIRPQAWCNRWWPPWSTEEYLRYQKTGRAGKPEGKQTS